MEKLIKKETIEVEYYNLSKEELVEIKKEYYNKGYKKGYIALATELCRFINQYYLKLNLSGILNCWGEIVVKINKISKVKIDKYRIFP